MNRILLLSSALILLTGGQPPPARAAQGDEAERLRAELVRARLENLDLKLKLARLSQKPAEEFRILEEALEAALPELSAAAFRELAALPEGRRREAAPLVLSRLAAGSEAFRAQAVAFLGRVPAPEAAAAVLKSAGDPSPAIRKAVASALKSASGEAAQEALLALLRDRDRDVRLAALETLGVAKRDDAVKPVLGALAAEKDEQAVEKMVDALGVIGSPAAVDDLLALLGRTGRDPIRWSCINSLGKIGDPRAAERLRAFLGEAHPIEVRQVSIEALGKLKDSAALPRIAEILRRDRQEKLRQSAATALGLMAGAEAIEATLLPAYLEDASESVRRAVWEAILSLAADRFAPNERLAMALLKAGRRPEADQVCTRLHAAKGDSESRDRGPALEEAVAAAAFQAGDFKSALPHFRHLATLAPARPDVARRIAACYRGLGDVDTCLKTLVDLKDPEIVVEETHALLQGGVPEEKRKAVEQALRAAALRLAEPLAGKDETAKKAALEAVRRQGRRILPSLAAELEENPKVSPAVLEAGSLITGIANEPATNASKAKAAGWRAWLEKKP